MSIQSNHVVVMEYRTAAFLRYSPITTYVWLWKLLQNNEYWLLRCISLVDLEVTVCLVPFMYMYVPLFIFVHIVFCSHVPYYLFDLDKLFYIYVSRSATTLSVFAWELTNERYLPKRLTCYWKHNSFSIYMR